MSVYPLRFQLGPIEITGFGLMMMVAFLFAGWAAERELHRRGRSDEFAWSLVVAAAFGGIVGAKLWYFALHHSVDALFSRGGLVWYGGFLGGVTAVIVNSIRLKVPTRFTAELTAPSLAIGYSLGRVGCFLVQDDYGRATDLPWAMAFPNGVPPTTAQNMATVFGHEIPQGASPFEVLAVHPTQLYEAAIMMLVFWLLWRLRAHQHAVGWLFALYLVCAGSERLLVEFFRAKDDRLLGPFTVAQLASTLAVLVGIALLVKWNRKDAFPETPEAPILASR